ncbi:MAG: hypothetical protein SFY69_09745 [Planctomycetota bacterium]|nr:hypothetical protein [Planctomycetota bacterium]
MTDARSTDHPREPAPRGPHPADPGASSLESTIERVFLTPRVVDERAFEDYAASLRALLRESHAREDALRRAGVEVKGIAEHLAQASSSLREQLSARPAGATEELRTLVRVEVERALARGGAGAGEPRGGGPDGHEDLPARLGEAIERAASEAVVRVTALARQVEASAAAAGEAEARVRTLLRTLDERAGEVSRAVDASCSGAAESAAHLDRESRGAAATLGASLAEFERRAQTLSTGLEAALVDFERRAARAREAPEAEDATALAARVDDARRVGEALAALVSRAEQVGRALHALTRGGERGADGAGA